MGSVVIEPGNIREENGRYIGLAQGEFENTSIARHGEITSFTYDVEFPPKFTATIKDTLRQRRPVLASWIENSMDGETEMADTVEIL